MSYHILRTYTKEVNNIEKEELRLLTCDWMNYYCHHQLVHRKPMLKNMTISRIRLDW